MITEPQKAPPSTIGEIFARAFVLLRNDFVALYGTVVLFTLPFILLQATSNDVLGAAILAAVGPHPGPDAFDKIARVLETHHREIVTAVVLPFVAGLSSEIALAAVAVRIGTRLRGVRAGLAVNVQTAFARFGSIVAIGIVTLCALIAVMLLVIVAIVSLASVALALAAVLPAARPSVGIAAGVFCGLLIFVLGVLTVVASRVAIVITADEQPNPVAAIGAAMRRIFGYGAFRRTLLHTLTVGATFIAELLTVVVVSGLASAAHGPDVLVMGLTGLTSGLFGAFLDVAIVLYAIDARDRFKVVQERSAAAAAPLPVVVAPPPVRSRAPAGDLDASDHARIDEYIARRETLLPVERIALAASIAGALRPKLYANFGYLDDDALIEFLAETRL